METTVQATMETNRRKSYRTPCDLRAMVTTTASEEWIPNTRLKDASREGMGLFSWEPIKPGQTIKLCVSELAASRSIEAMVRRCHHTPSGKFEVGVLIDPQSAALFKRLYEELWEVECYRQVIQNARGQSITSATALSEWRARYAPVRFMRHGAG